MDANEANSASKPNVHMREKDCIDHIEKEIAKIAEAAVLDEVWVNFLRAMEECLENITVKETL